MALDIRIAGRYKLGRKIGSGSFGDIYLGENFDSLSSAKKFLGWVCAARPGAEVRKCGCRHTHPDSRGSRHQTGEHP